MSLEIVIFDMDGVLVDACEWHKIALNQALKEKCNYEISEEEHYSTFNGLPTRVKLDKLSEMGVVDKDTHEEINNLKQEKTIEIIEKYASFDESKVSLIKWLKENDIKVACFTNSIRKTASMMLERVGVLSLMDVFVTNQDVSNPKPDPEGYNKILKLFKIKSENAIIVEDSPKGLAAAKASGCRILKVKNATEVNTENVRKFIYENFDTNGWSG